MMLNQCSPLASKAPILLFWTETEMLDRHALPEQSVRYDIVMGAKNTGLRVDNWLF